MKTVLASCFESSPTMYFHCSFSSEQNKNFENIVVEVTNYSAKFLSRLGFYTEACFFLSTVRKTNFIHKAL